jgi:hypothetical protein
MQHETCVEEKWTLWSIICYGKFEINIPLARATGYMRGKYKNWYKKSKLGSISFG